VGRNGATFLPGQWAFACLLPLKATEFDPIVRVDMRVRVDQEGIGDAVGIL
jgi:hypothetical protein